MNSRCHQCGGEFIMLDATPEILASTEGWPDFAKLILDYGGDPTSDVQVGLCPTCNVRILLGPEITIEGQITE